MRRYCQHLLQKLSNNGGVDAATEQKKPPKRNSSGGFLFCPRQQMCCLSGNTIENQGLVCPNSLISFIIPEILHIVVAVILF